MESNDVTENGGEVADLMEQFAVQAETGFEGHSANARHKAMTLLLRMAHTCQRTAEKAKP